MYNKSLQILIQRGFSKFPFINKFDSISGGQGLYNGVRPLGKLLSTKLKICIAEG